MLIVTSNSGGGWLREETLHRRPYLVAPITLIVPGVLDGSDGPIHYPSEELSAEPLVWNGVPLVGYHPFQDGTPISARRPDVLDRQGLGMVLNVGFEGKLAGEAWFDLLATETFDRGLDPSVRIVPRLRRKDPIEMSTGLFSKKEPAAAGATFNGKPYHHIARNYRPDHVAVLPDQLGACQIKDGCGIMINHYRPCACGEPPMPLTPEQKQAHATYLTTNCAWWKKPGDNIILNNLPDDKLVELRESAERAATPPVVTPPAAPTIDLSKLTPEQVKDLKSKLGIAEPAAVTPPPTPPPVAVTPAAPVVPVVPVVPVAAPLTSNQWLESAPPEIRSVFQNALAVEKREKDQLVARLTANVADPAARQAAGQMLTPKPLEELRALALLMPTANGQPNTQTPAAIFLGMSAPGPVTGMAGYDPVNGSEQDLLMPPTINWGKPTQESRQASREATPTPAAAG